MPGADKLFNSSGDKAIGNQIGSKALKISETFQLFDKNIFILLLKMLKFNAIFPFHELFYELFISNSPK